MRLEISQLHIETEKVKVLITILPVPSIQPVYSRI